MNTGINQIICNIMDEHRYQSDHINIMDEYRYQSDLNNIMDEQIPISS